MIYEPEVFDLKGLKGISDETMEMHFKLYEGYVKNTNLLQEKIAEMLQDGQVDQEEAPAYAELKRRYGFEYNGMVLHEYYFGNLSSHGAGEPARDSEFRRAAERSLGSFDLWKADFISTGNMRGVGWAICYQDHRGNLSNHWITLHEVGNVTGFWPILIMDVWEHAFLLDYKPSEKNHYIESFFDNVNWDEIERRIIPLDRVSSQMPQPQHGLH